MKRRKHTENIDEMIEILVSNENVTVENKMMLDMAFRYITDEVYKIKDARISYKVKKNIENYIKGTELSVVYLDDNSMLINNEDEIEEDFEDAVVTQEQIDNAKEIYKNKVNNILKLMEIEDIKDVENLDVDVTEYITFTDKKGIERENQPVAIQFYKDKQFDSIYKSEGHPPYISIAINNKGELAGMSYKWYSIKKINKQYEFKTIDEITSDIIKYGNNVLIECVYNNSSDEYVEDWSDVIAEDVEVVLDCTAHTDTYRHVVPYYIIKGHNKRNDEIKITMPAIKNKYLNVSEGLKEDLEDMFDNIIERVR